jgi:hypothetical protein
MITAQENKTKARLYFSPVLRFLKIFLTGRCVHASAPLTQVQYSQTELLEKTKQYKPLGSSVSPTTQFSISSNKIKPISLVQSSATDNTICPEDPI